MTRASFKKFTEFVDAEEAYSDEQICEIFGLFKNNDKLDKLKAAREKLKADELAKKKEISKKQDDIWAAHKAKLAGTNVNPNDVKAAARAKLDTTPGSQMRGAQSRAAERNWAMGESRLNYR